MQNKTSFKKGHLVTDEMKAKIGFANSEERSTCWKGDSAGYGAKHKWVRKHFGSPMICENCKTKTIDYMKYLKYVLRHKWFVMFACFKDRLYWQGIIHDMSKFLPSEFFPYANFFYNKNPRNKSGYYKPTDTGDKAFDFAWLLHQKRNRHHWQWWVLPEDEGGVKVLEMEDKHVREMLCDWEGAGRAQHNEIGVANWYLSNKHKMQLHPNTKKHLEEKLKI